MKRVIYLLLLLLPLCISAQDCKYSTDKVDPITNKRTLVTKQRINYWYNIRYLRIGDESRIEFIVYMPGDKKIMVPAGSTTDIKLANDKVITIESMSDAAPTAYISGDQVYSVYLMSYILQPDQARAMASAGIKYSKTHLSGESFYEHTYKDGETERSKTAASCVYIGGKPATATATSTQSSATKKVKEDDDSIIEIMMRKKQAKKDAEEAASKPAPAKPAESPAQPAPVAQPKPLQAATPTPQPTTSTPTPQPVATPLSAPDELMKWKKLLDSGVITKEEFEAQKKKILEK